MKNSTATPNFRLATGHQEAHSQADYVLVPKLQITMNHLNQGLKVVTLPHINGNALEIPRMPWYEARDSYLLIQGKRDHESLLNGDIPLHFGIIYQESAAANHKPCWIRKHILRSTKKIASKKSLTQPFTTSRACAEWTYFIPRRIW